MAITYIDYNKDVTLVQRICTALRKMIRDGVYEVGTQLPNEIELAKLFNVSRATIRSSLQILEQSGIVLRRRGLGTFVAKEPMLINNLSMNFGITQVIESIGAIAGTEYIDIYTSTATDAQIEDRLQLAPSSKMVVIERVRTADSRRVAFTRDIFGLETFNRLFSGTPVDELKEYLLQGRSLYTFLHLHLEKPIHHAIAHILPVKCVDSQITSLLGIAANSVLMEIEQVDFSTDGRPIWMAREYHMPDMFTFSVYRMN